MSFAQRGVVLALFLMAACLSDPVGPRGVFLQSLTVSNDSTLLGTPGLPLPKALRFRAVDADGRAVPAERVEWALEGTGAHLLSADSVTGSDGTFQAIWVLGTNASEPQRLNTAVHVGSHVANLITNAVAKPVVVSQVHFTAESLTVKLGVPTLVRATATDPYGNVFTPASLKFLSTDTAGVTVDSTAQLHVHRRGYLRVVATADGVADTAVIHGIQVVATIVPSINALSFQALGEQRAMIATMIDDQGLPVLDSLPASDVAPTGVVEVQVAETTVVKSQANGAGTLTLSAGPVVKQVPFSVVQAASHVVLAPAGPTFDALSDTLRLSATVQDSLGFDLATPALVFASSDSNVVSVDAGGLLRSRRNGTASIVGRAASGASDTLAITVAQRVASVTILADTIRFDALQASANVGAVAKDRLGNAVGNAVIAYVASNPLVASVDTTGRARALTNGTTLVYAAANGDTAKVIVIVAQRPVRVLLPSDTIRFVALGETQSVVGIAVDSLGFAVTGGVRSLSLSDTTPTTVVDSTTLRSRANGVSVASFTVAGLPSHVNVVVSQVADTVTAAIRDSFGVQMLWQDSLIPLGCSVLDRNRFPMAVTAVVAPSSGGRWSGTRCDSLKARASGIDTLQVQYSGHVTRVPVAIAVHAIVTPAMGNYLVSDSFPTATGPWAPSIRRNSGGLLEVYATGYQADTVHGGFRGNLHRYVSHDNGVTFQYDGVALTRDDSLCSLNGTGIENIAIVPRSDGPGWRMYYAAGSTPCYGWQVFSATSNDERTWVKEPGIRLSNGLPITQPHGSPPWPAGEGMVVDQLPDGEWRMIVSTYEHITPPENKFQITEWHSPDQLNWTYIRTVFSTRQLPPEGQRSVFSPTIRQFAPGLWRMIVTADNLNVPGGRSHLWSAVSTDEVHWQFEGELIGAVGSNFNYCNLVDNVLVFMRQDTGLPRRLALATVAMP